MPRHERLGEQRPIWSPSRQNIHRHRHNLHLKRNPFCGVCLSLPSPPNNVNLTWPAASTYIVFRSLQIWQIGNQFSSKPSSSGIPNDILALPPPPWVRKAGIKSSGPYLGVELSWVQGQIYCTVIDKNISKMGVESSKWVVNLVKVYSLVNRTLSNISKLFMKWVFFSSATFVPKRSPRESI